MPEDRKVFDIARPVATASSRPVIAPSPPAPDPMVKAPEPPKSQMPTSPTPFAAPISIKVTSDEPVEKAPEPPTEPTPDLAEEPKPELTSIPVSEAPQDPVVKEEPMAITESAPSTVTPALPGAPLSDFSNIPKFGELQAKVDAHPLFSGQKERRIKVRRIPHFVAPFTILLVLIVGGFLLVDSGVVSGASHLPFHVFKQAAPVKLPTISQVNSNVKKDVTSTGSQATAAADPYASWLGYSSAFSYSFKYPKDYVTFNVQTRNDSVLAESLKSVDPASDPADANGPITILDYKVADQPVASYTNGPTIVLGKTGWVVKAVSKDDPNKYKVGDAFKDISMVYNKQKQSLYTIQSTSSGQLNYTILFVAKDALHEIVLPPFATSTNGVANDQAAYDKMYQMIRDSITISS